MNGPDAFWKRVDASGGVEACWPFIGARNASGYGWLRGQPHGFDDSVGAHRIAHFLATGVRQAYGEVVRHRCDNPPCCNPDHLVLGTQGDNIADMLERGRGSPPPPPRFGEANNKARLKVVEVFEIKRRLRSGERPTAISRDYGVNDATICDIKAERTWRHVA